MNEEKILYHGSPCKYDILVPHQAYDTGFAEGCQNAVYATTNKNMALGFALGGIPNERGELEREMMPEYGDKMVFKKGTPNYDGKGYLYILDQESFVHAMGTQWVCYENVKPLKVIEIEVNDYLDTCIVEEKALRFDRNLLPEKIRELTAGQQCNVDDIGLSTSTVIVFEDRVLKIDKYSPEIEATIQMMRWLDGKIPVPKVIWHEVKEDISYLLMSKVEGEMSCAEYYLEHPHELTSLLAEGLHMLWSIDISDCPRVRDLDAELVEAQYRVEQGLVDVSNAEPDTFGAGGFENPAALLTWLSENKPVSEPVLSHGDYCLPNVLLSDGKINGFIDLGDAGIADKWKDISLCYRSLKHNFDGTFGGKVYPDFNPDMLFEKLGIEPDWEKLRYYILLDELF